MSEALILEALSADNVKEMTVHIAENIPSRAAGSANGRRMAEYSRDRLLASGVPARVHEFPGLVSFPEAARLRVTAPGEMALAANTLGHSLPVEDLRGELVYVGSGGFADYEGKDVRGKIILAELSYSPARHEKTRIAGLKGAAGAIMMNWGRPEDTAVPFGSVKQAWGNPTPETFETEMPRLPCITTSRAVGLQLKALCEAGPVQVEMSAVVENPWRPVHLTEGEIPGAASEDFVLVAGHQDSWPGPAATDNASGNAVILELMRVFQQHRHLLRRGLVACFWTGHETGTMIGSTWYVDQNWKRLRDHAVGYVLIDQPACTGMVRWGASSNVELKDFHQKIERRLLGDREITWERKKKHGDCSLFGMGVPMIFNMGAFSKQELAETAGANWGWWHHSLECTIDKVNFDDMPAHLRVYAAYLWELCTALILPYSFTESAEHILDRLRELETLSGGFPLEDAVTAGERLLGAARHLDALAEMWKARPEAEAATAAEILNRGMKKLTRILIPLSSTAKGTYEHDPYGLTAQTKVLPSLYDLQQLKNLPEAPERWMLETKLRREANRVADMLGDAAEIAEATLAAAALRD